MERREYEHWGEREILYIMQSFNCKLYKIFPCGQEIVSPRTSFEMTTFLFLPNTCGDNTYYRLNRLSPAYSVIFTMVAGSAPKASMLPVEVNGIDWAAGAFGKA